MTNKRDLKGICLSCGLCKPLNANNICEDCREEWNYYREDQSVLDSDPYVK